MNVACVDALIDGPVMFPAKEPLDRTPENSHPSVCPVWDAWRVTVEAVRVPTIVTGLIQLPVPLIVPAESVTAESVSVIEREHDAGAARHPLHTPAALRVEVTGAVVVEDLAQPTSIDAATARASANRIIDLVDVRYQKRMVFHLLRLIQTSTAGDPFPGAAAPTRLSPSPRAASVARSRGAGRAA